MPRRSLVHDGLSLDAFFAAQVRTGFVERVLQLAIDEDVGAVDASSHATSAGSRFVGDITSEACDLANAELSAGVVARASAAGGVVAGLAVVQLLASKHFPLVAFTPRARDGDVLAGRTRVAHVQGPARQCLLLERTMLNLLGRLSGIASLTRTYVLAASAGAADASLVAHVCDTRKTTPGLRVLEKYAVRCGGGVSHRLGLHDALLIKDNHLAGIGLGSLASFVTQAAAKARALAGGTLAFAEVEVDSIEQFRVLLQLPRGVIDVVLLDNMPAALLRECCAMRDAAAPWLLLEASGGVNLQTIREIAQSGVDRVSVGALTHSAVQLDFGLDVVESAAMPRDRAAPPKASKHT